MSRQYLWDRRDGRPDPFVVRLERALACLRVPDRRRRSMRRRADASERANDQQKPPATAVQPR